MTFTYAPRNLRIAIVLSNQIGYSIAARNKICRCVAEEVDKPIQYCGGEETPEAAIITNQTFYYCNARLFVFIYYSIFAIIILEVFQVKS